MSGVPANQGESSALQAACGATADGGHASQDSSSTGVNTRPLAGVAQGKIVADTHRKSQSRGEEIANSISHGLALLAALGAAPLLVLSAARKGDALDIVAASVFALTMVLLYAVSMLYHAMPSGSAKQPARAKPVFQILDHSAIYLLIAGTYTPFALGPLRGPWGWTLFGLVWAMAVGGIAAKAFAGTGWPRLSTVLYLGMGWVAVIAAKPMWEHIPGWGLIWLLAGGIFYTAGVAFFATDHKVRYGHFIWHLFVAAGTACHVVAVLFYAFD